AKTKKPSLQKGMRVLKVASQSVDRQGLTLPPSIGQSQSRRKLSKTSTRAARSVSARYSAALMCTANTKKHALQKGMRVLKVASQSVDRQGLTLPPSKGQYQRKRQLSKTSTRSGRSVSARYSAALMCTAKTKKPSLQKGMRVLKVASQSVDRQGLTLPP